MASRSWPRRRSHISAQLHYGPHPIDATVHELAESVLTPPAFYVYHADPKARLLDALARIRDAPDQFDGASRFCQAHTPGLLAVA